MFERGGESLRIRGFRPIPAIADEKKAGVVEDPQVPDHAGLLFDGPPAMAGLSLV